MPRLLEGLLRSELATANVELLPEGATPDQLQHSPEDAPPPVVIISADGPDATAWERAFLRPHPDAVVLRVEGDGRILSSRAAEIRRRACPGAMTTEQLIHTIESAPRWRERFG